MPPPTTPTAPTVSNPLAAVAAGLRELRAKGRVSVRALLHGVLLLLLVRLVRRAFAAAAASRAAARLQARADRKRAERNARRAEALRRLPAFADIEDGLAMVSLTVAGMREAMELGTYTSEQLVTACCARAAQAARDLNSNAEERYLEAISDARQRDAERRAGRVRGPLHGVPLSVKDQVNMRGFDSTCGLASRTFQPEAESSLLVTLLVDAGAVPFVRSNVPQGLMVPETSNYIWGTTCNPYAADRSSGGSSGGEGALIGTRASPMGIGTDIGGSVRIPALNCGVTGFKPTPSRMSQQGVAAPKKDDNGWFNGQYGVLSAAGPMAKTVDDVAEMMDVWCARMGVVDNLVPDLKWNRAAAAAGGKKLTYGVIRYDGFFPVDGAVARAVQEAADAVRARGHRVVEVEHDLSWHASAYLSLMMCEGKLRSFRAALEGEKVHEYYRLLEKTSSFPNALTGALAAVFRFVGQPRMASIVEGGYHLAAHEYMGVCKRRDAQKNAFMAYLKAQGIDAVLCPQMACPPWRHGECVKLNMAASYTFLFNTLHFPCGGVPVTHVREDEQTYKPRVAFNDSYHKQAASNSAGSAGLPIGVQVATLPFQDELCIKAMREVELGVSFAQPVLDATTAFVTKPQ